MKEIKESIYNIYLPDDAAIANTRSGAIALLDLNAYDALTKNGPSALTQEQKIELTEKGIFVREDLDEIGDVLDARQERKNCFRILTTTRCNASCGYCYQKGISAVDMERQTAEQTAVFISRLMRNRTDPAWIEWFGGEPLLNTDAIDTVSGRLKELGVRFRSTITTNALGFSHELISRIGSSWKLVSAQVTLDGVEKRHEEIKGFQAGSFDRILTNLKIMMRHGIRVKIRINHIDSDAERELIELLAREFRDCSGMMRISLSPLYQDCGENRVRSMEEILDLRKHIFKLGMNRNRDPFRLHAVSERCSAAAGGFTIAPDGKLYTCHHCMTEDQCFGSVWEYREDNTARLRFVSAELPDKCKHCICLPFCLGGCRAAELGLAEMEQCHPDSIVFDRIIRIRSKLNKLFIDHDELKRANIQEQLYDDGRLHEI